MVLDSSLKTKLRWMVDLGGGVAQQGVQDGSAEVSHPRQRRLLHDAEHVPRVASAIHGILPVFRWCCFATQGGGFAAV